MNLEKQLSETEALGNDHIGSSGNTPLRANAFEMSDVDKISSIEKDVTNILETLGMDLTDDSLKGTPFRVAKMFVQEIFGGRLSGKHSIIQVGRWVIAVALRF